MKKAYQYNERWKLVKNFLQNLKLTEFQRCYWIMQKEYVFFKSDQQCRPNYGFFTCLAIIL
jgi:hypothetical protein